MVSLAPPVVRFVFLIMHAHRFLETLHTGFCIEFVYSYLIGNFGDVKYFIHINWYVPIFPMSALISLISIPVGTERLIISWVGIRMQSKSCPHHYVSCSALL